MKETDESRNQRFQDAATIHNLILVSVSPRRSIVVRVDHSAGWRADTAKWKWLLSSPGACRLWPGVVLRLPRLLVGKCRAGSLRPRH